METPDFRPSSPAEPAEPTAPEETAAPAEIDEPAAPTETNDPTAPAETAALSDPVPPETPPRRSPESRANRTRLIALIAAVAVLMSALAVFLIVRGVRNRRPPDLETLRPRIVELIESAREVNEILFGAGLPTYPRIYEEHVPFTAAFEGEEYSLYYYTFPDDAYGTVIAYQYYVRVRNEGESGYTYYDLENGGVLPTGFARYHYAKRTEKPDTSTPLLCHSEESGYYYYALEGYDAGNIRFYTVADEPYYDYVREDCGYLSVEDIRTRAAEVYSPEYLDSIAESIFVGITVSDRDSGTLYARYYDYQNDIGEIFLVKSNTQEGLDLGTRIWDYDTMRMVKPSHADYVNVEIETYLAGHEDERVTVRVSLALSGGTWFLDSPTY